MSKFTAGILIFQIALAMPSAFARAKGLSKAEEGVWQGKVAAACVKSTAEHRKDLSEAKRQATCDCVARNHIRLAAEESAKTAAAQLDFIVKRFADGNWENDPFQIFDYDYKFAESCLQNPSYRFDNEPVQ